MNHDEMGVPVVRFRILSFLLKLILVVIIITVITIIIIQFDVFIQEVR